ncbi:hypothetical protein [Rufibacter roseus]|uniref:Uncharacterized protein n=2 Tax=Rufibacter roseus TaxID=1567108 RepID=A0ABW2DJX5_9BACT|nr:hypothetical protein [Rufibacter roseus]
MKGNTEHTVEKSITLITLGYTDSANEQNKGHGIAKYLFIDLENDSIVIYERVTHYDTAIYTTRSQLSGRVYGLSKNPKILSWFQGFMIFPSGNHIPPYEEGTLYCGNSYLVFLQSDTLTKALAFHHQQAFQDLNMVVKAIVDSSAKTHAFQTQVNLKEDSILGRILSNLDFDDFMAVPPPPPDAPPPPPPINR